MKQKGGSVASDAVTSLVTADTYAKMNNIFSNNYSKGQCGGSKQSANCGGRSAKKHTSNKRGGGPEQILGAVKNVLSAKSTFVDAPFKSSPAPALNSVLPRNVGVKDTFINAGSVPQLPKLSNFVNANKAHFTNASKAPVMMDFTGQEAVKVTNTLPANILSQFSNNQSDQSVKPFTGGKRSCKKGGAIKSVAELMSQNAGLNYELRNKKGGFSKKDNLGLNYNAVKTTRFPLGDTINRSQQEIQNKMLATESVPGLPLVQKFTEYGKPADNQMKYSYASEKMTFAPPTGGSAKTSFGRLLEKAKALVREKKASPSSRSTKTKTEKHSVVKSKKKV